jgi:hypothetical protein
MIRSSKKLSKDTNKRAHQIAELLTGGADQVSEPQRSPISAYLAEIGRKGGLKGGKARAKKLTQEQRSEIASNAAKVRWKTAG